MIPIIAFRWACDRARGHEVSQVVRGSFSGVSMHGAATILPHFSAWSRFPRVFGGSSGRKETVFQGQDFRFLLRPLPLPFVLPLVMASRFRCRANAM